MIMGTFPNPETQFQPGQSGNPAGKPKGAKHLSSRIQQLMDDPNFEMMLPDPREGWKTFKGTPMDAIVGVAMRKAALGDQRWADWLGKYGYATRVVLEGDPEAPLNAPADQSLVDAFINNVKDATAKQAKSD